jgi:ABC-type nitrate/sulfonate/bicarbonate transport system substrate-binding protein
VRLITFSRPITLLAALYKGFFKQHGLTVEADLTRGSVEQIRGLLEGRWDVAHTAADNVMAYVDREGVDLFVFAVADLGVGQKLIVRPEITSYEGLRGQPLAVDALDTGYAFVLRRMLEQHGLAWGSYELVPVGSTPQRLQALRDGRVVGALLSSPPDDEFSLLGSAAESFPLYPGLTAATTRRWASAHPADLLGYTRALLAAARWAADPRNADEAVELIARDQHVDTQTARRRYQLEVESRSIALPTLDQILAGLDVVRRLRQALTGSTTGLEAYVDLSYMERALAEVSTLG